MNGRVFPFHQWPCSPRFARLTDSGWLSVWEWWIPRRWLELMRRYRLGLGWNCRRYTTSTSHLLSTVVSQSEAAEAEALANARTDRRKTMCGKHLVGISSR